MALAYSFTLVILQKLDIFVFKEAVGDAILVVEFHSCNVSQKAKLIFAKCNIPIFDFHSKFGVSGFAVNSVGVIFWQLFASVFSAWF